MKNNLTKWIIILLLCPIQLVGIAQNDYEHYLLRQASASNIAAGCWHEGSYLSAHFLNKFCKKEMMEEVLEVQHAYQKNCLIGILSHSGFSRFGELTASIGYGRTFGQRFSVALQAVYLLSHADSYASIHSFTITLSAFCKMSDKYALAVELENPIRMRYGIVGGELIPMYFDVRLLYFPYRKINAFVYVHKVLPGELDIGAGGIWQAHRNLMFGLSASNTHLQADIHIPFNKIITAIACQWHFHTGFSPRCSIAIEL